MPKTVLQEGPQDPRAGRGHPQLGLLPSWLAGTDAAGLGQQHQLMYTTGDPTAGNPPWGDRRHASGGSRPRASSRSAPPSTHLGGHHLGVGAADLHARIEASLVVGLHNVTSVHLICSNPAVIRAWGGGRRHQVNKAVRRKSHQPRHRDQCWSQRIYGNQTVLPSTVHQCPNPRPRAQWWCNLSLIYAAQQDWLCTGGRPRDKQSSAGCAPRHHPDSQHFRLQTLFRQQLALFVLRRVSRLWFHRALPHSDCQGKTSSPPGGRELLQTALPSAGLGKAGWETPGPLPGGAGPFANSRGEIFPAEFSSP